MLMGHRILYKQKKIILRVTDGQSDYDRDGYKVWHMVGIWIIFHSQGKSVCASELMVCKIIKNPVFSFDQIFWTCTCFVGTAKFWSVN